MICVTILRLLRILFTQSDPQIVSFLVKENGIDILRLVFEKVKNY
jgi:hypothetical protein